MKKGISGYQLKILGISLMVLDHIHQMFYYAGAPTFLTMLGRLVLPIFLFMSVEGYHYTHNKKRYALRLLIGFWIMNILSIIISRFFPLDEVMLINNIFGTMFLAILGMFVVDSLKNKRWLKGITALLLPLIPYIMMIAIMNVNPLLAAYTVYIFPSYFTAEGGFLIILLAIFMYIFRGKRFIQYTFILICSIISTGFNFYDLVTSNFQWMMVFSIIPISLYNGTRGEGSKYFFYIFYPAHIYFLYILSYLYTTY